jgi:hypothetical protein
MIKDQGTSLIYCATPQPNSTCPTWRVESQAKAMVISQSTYGLLLGAEDLEKAGIHIDNLGDTGEMLDDQAKAAYRRRLSE